MTTLLNIGLFILLVIAIVYFLGAKHKYRQLHKQYQQEKQNHKTHKQ